MSSLSTWHTEKEIKPEHSSLLIKQIYLWFITSDNYIAIVGKNNKFQFPGGKPENSESKLETIERELFEEAGITLENFNEKPIFFGYYLVKDSEESYLQLRYFVKVNLSHEQIQLSVNERESDLDQLEEAKFVKFEELPKHIPWTERLEEYGVVRSLV